MKRVLGQRKHEAAGVGYFGQFTQAMAALSSLSVGMFVLGVVRGDGWGDWYMIWNLFLAWIPLILAYALVVQLRRLEWSSWTGISLTLAWLLFLPNSFYIVSDLIHLQDMPRKDVLFDSLMFTAFVLNGLLLGYASLYLVQRLVAQHGVSRRRSNWFAIVMLLLCSFAIYLGRDLRWNSWDVLLNPAGILFDVSERILDPFGHPAVFSTTAVFFLFLGGLYWVLGRLGAAVIGYAKSVNSK
jgi:uncharacterized membrane protein